MRCGQADGRSSSACTVRHRRTLLVRLMNSAGAIGIRSTPICAAKDTEQADAEDYVQSFLTNLLRDELLAGADPEKGRLRNYLITLLNRHVAARRERDGAKSGVGASPMCRSSGKMPRPPSSNKACAAGSPERSVPPSPRDPPRG